MNHRLLPPSGLYTFSVGPLFDNSVTDSEKLLLTQLLVLTYGSKRRPVQTPLVPYDELAQLLGKSTRSIRYQITALQKRFPDLRFLEDKNGFILIVPDRYFASQHPGFRQKMQNLPQKPRQKPQSLGQDTPSSSDDLPQSLKEEVKEEYKEQDINSNHLLLNPSSSMQQPENSPQSGKTDVKKPDKPDKGERPPLDLSKMRILPPRVKDELLGSGIFPALMSEVACSGYSDDELLQLLSWTRDTQPQNPAPLFISRLRMGAKAPPEYAKPPCPTCGQRGGHAPDCRRSWIDGPYAEYIISGREGEDDRWANRFRSDPEEDSEEEEDSANEDE